MSVLPGFGSELWRQDRASARTVRTGGGLYPRPGIGRTKCCTRLNDAPRLEDGTRDRGRSNCLCVRTLAAIAAAVPVRLMKRDLLFVVERLAALLDESRLEIVARGRRYQEGEGQRFHRDAGYRLSTPRRRKRAWQSASGNHNPALGHSTECCCSGTARRGHCLQSGRGFHSFEGQKEFAAKEKAKLSKKPFAKDVQPRASKMA